MYKNEKNLYLTPSKRVIQNELVLNLEPEIIKLLEENRKKGFWHCFGQLIFLDLTPKWEATKAKTDKWDCSKQTSFMAKETTVKRQPMKKRIGTALVVLWLRLHASTEGGFSSIPGRSN